MMNLMILSKSCMEVFISHGGKIVLWIGVYVVMLSVQLMISQNVFHFLYIMIVTITVLSLTLLRCRVYKVAQKPLHI